MKMITNLFSIFDPSFYWFKFQWIIILTPIILTNKNKYIIKIKNPVKIIIRIIIKEIKTLLIGKEKNNITIILLSIFILIITINTIALSPFTFTTTAHISVSFSLALLIWLTIILFGWIKYFKKIIVHLVPIGTPYPLINFIVIIEIIRNIIRPITLSVRLSANIVAGHLLIRLLRNFCIISPTIITRFPLLIILSLLEIAVALIQAYVFITLLTLYSSEI